MAQQNSLKQVLQISALQHAGISISVRDHKGQIILEHNPQLNLIPASTVKTLTAMMALEFLADTFRYNTDILLQGNVDDSGTLEGALLIAADGDPSFCSKEFELSINDFCQSIYKELKKNNINCIEHLSFYSSHPDRPAINDTWLWQDVANYYAGGVQDFNILDNSYSLCFDTKNPIGTKPKMIHIKPTIPQLSISNELRIASQGTGDQSYIYYTSNGQRVIRGTLPKGSTSYCVQGSIPDPKLFFAQYLSDYLSQRDISLINHYNEIKQIPPTARRIHSIPSPFLQDLLQLCLEKSINLFAEGIMTSLMNQLHLNTPQDVLDRFIGLLSLKNDGIILYDGSGLSPRNAISAGTFTEILYKIQEKKWFDHFVNTLAEAGKEGTLKHWMKNNTTNKKIYAKSGSMSGVICYTGYVFEQNKPSYSFALLFNDFDMSNQKMRKLVEQFFEDLLKELH